MAKSKTNKGLLTLLLIIGIAFISIGAPGTYRSIFGTDTQAFSLVSTGNEVYEPDFASIRCEKTDVPTSDIYYYVTGDPENPTTYVEDDSGNLLRVLNGDFAIECSRGIDKTYTNQCLVELKLTPTDIRTEFSLNSFVCRYDEFNTDNCEDITGYTTDFNIWNTVDRISNTEVIRVSDFKKNLLYFDRDIDRGDFVFRTSRDEYGLVVDTGRKEVLNSCDLNDLLRLSNKDIISSVFSSAKNDGRVTGTTLNFGATINYVTGFKPIVESDRIISDGKYYTYGNGIKYPIVTGESGRKYVDLENKVYDSNIICDPAGLYCINDGTKIDVQFGVSAECDASTDLIDGWLPYTQKDNYVAQRVCVDGKWKEVNAKPIPNCTGEKPVLNQNYECVAGTDQEGGQEQQQEKDWTPTYILAFGALLVIAYWRYK